MLFIEELMYSIRKEEYMRYKRQLNIAKKMPAKELYNQLEKKINSLDMVVHQKREITMIALPTSGCPHYIREGGFCGCSMCNYNLNLVEDLAKMAVLKLKGPDLYGLLIENSLYNTRKSLIKPSVVELITGYDCLNSEEIPDQVFYKLISEKKILKRKVDPIVSIFETRATSVTKEKLLGWKKNLGKKVVVEFGLEVSNEWIRNYWINKNISDGDVKNALKIIREAGCESSGNILIGIPGCTEKQSIQLFKESAIWLYQNGCNHILCSALSRKRNTLQHYLWQIGNYNSDLCNIGIFCGEHTCIPWIFTVMEAICQLLEEHREVVSCFTLSPPNFPLYYEELLNISFEQKDMYVVKKGIDSLKEFGQSHDVDKLREHLEGMKRSNLYKKYLSLIRKQEKAGGLNKTFYNIAKACVECIWPEDFSIKMKQVEQELSAGEWRFI